MTTAYAAWGITKKVFSTLISPHHEVHFAPADILKAFPGRCSTATDVCVACFEGKDECRCTVEQWRLDFTVTLFLERLRKHLDLDWFREFVIQDLYTDYQTELLLRDGVTAPLKLCASDLLWAVDERFVRQKCVLCRGVLEDCDCTQYSWGLLYLPQFVYTVNNNGHVAWLVRLFDEPQEDEQGRRRNPRRKTTVKRPDYSCNGVKLKTVKMEE